SSIRLGWIGVRSNFFHLRMLEDVFAKLNAVHEGRVRLVVVSSEDYTSEHIKVENIRWSLEKESDEVTKFDIGLMPLQDDFFSRGKCSFKAIFCMAHGLPVVISAVGMNRDLIQQGVNGYLAETPDEWFNALDTLIQNVDLRRSMGERARKTV